MNYKVKNLGIMLDCSRNAVITPKTLKKYIPLLSKMGYNELQLYTEDTLLIDSEPYFGYLRGGYIESEIKEIILECDKFGIEVIPCVQTLGHMERALKQPVYAEYADTHNVLMTDDEKVYSFIEKIFSNARKLFKSNKINIGMDEAYLVGFGNHFKRFGYQSKEEIMRRHLKRVASIADKYSFTAMMWSDMFFDVGENGQQYIIREDAKAEIPANITPVYWDYYRTSEQHYIEHIKAHEGLKKDDLCFAAGAWSWVGFVPKNEHAFETFLPAVSACRKTGVTDLYITVWGDNGAECPYAAIFPALCYFAEAARGVTDINAVKEKFKAVFGADMDDFMLYDNINGVGVNKDPVQNPSKYMLYNDVFLGRFDCTVEENDAKEFKDIADKLKSLTSNADYGWMFNMGYYLARALSVKCDLGIRTRSAYLSGDKSALNALLADYDKTAEYITDFYYAFENAWHVEKKPFGFEVQEVRLSGLIGRIKACKRKLKKYLDGKIDKIEELEVKILDYSGAGEIKKRKKLVVNDWADNITTGSAGF
ncbi:MAG: beta-N-acetylhexosaminidase [Clostridia bacterium]|nr:beta-N-acetylhexosaminidase [Clostridia bacterium]